MTEIAVDADAERREPGEPGRLTGRVLARHAGWIVEDVICTQGPADRPFEEERDDVAVALVVSGSFQYRTVAGRALLTPGSVMLGNPGQPFVCGHEHGTGDRCLSFRYTPGVFEDLAAAGGARRSTAFPVARLPPQPALSALLARAGAAAAGLVQPSWEELSVVVAAEATRLSRGLAAPSTDGPPGAAARVTRVVRRIEQDPEAGGTLDELARTAGLSRYHFLRTFTALTGATPHQYLLRRRLVAAALRLLSGAEALADIALACGFSDQSAFTRAFRAEFGVSPLRYRRRG